MLEGKNPSGPGATRSYILRVRLTPYEADVLQEMAQREGMSLSTRAAAMIRGRIMAYERWKERRGGN